MAHPARVRAASCMVLSSALLCLLTRGAYSIAPSGTSSVRNSPPSSHNRTKKPAWHNGPASMPLDTEVVPPRASSIPPAVKNYPVSRQAEAKIGDKTEASPSLNPSLDTTRTSATGHKAASPASTESAGNVPCADLPKGSAAALNCLRTHPIARQAFYDDLRRTVEQVRSRQIPGRSISPAP